MSVNKGEVQPTHRRSRRYGACWRSACVPSTACSAGGCHWPAAPRVACRAACREAALRRAAPPVPVAAPAPAAAEAPSVPSQRLRRRPARLRPLHEAPRPRFGEQPQRRWAAAAARGPAPPGALPRHRRLRPRAARPAQASRRRVSRAAREACASPARAHAPAQRSSGARRAALGAPATLLPG
jgi:hypothetical protein